METYMQQPKLSSICLAVITSALLLTSTAGFAANYKGESSYKGEAMAPAPCPQPLMLRDGFYVGAQALYDSYRVRQTATGAVGPILFNTSEVIGANGWGGGIFGGYGMYFNNFYYLGAEVFVDGTGASQYGSFSAGAAPLINDNTAFNVGASWGISVLPGLKLNDSSLGYVRLGYEAANIRGRSAVTSTTVAAGAITNYGSRSSWQSGFDYGIGLETAVYPDVSVRGEFDHTSYSSITSGNTKFSPTDNQYTFGVSYHIPM
jgi:opacity protein-like surface antigen